MGLAISKKSSQETDRPDKPLPPPNNGGPLEVRVLLLGSGDTGKSTMFKQMNIIHDEGFDQNLILDYIGFIRSNCLKAIKALITGCSQLEIPIEDKHKELAEKYDSYEEDIYLKIGTVWDRTMADEIVELWSDEGIKKAYLRNNEFQFIENAKYLFDNMDRISADDYKPTAFDMLCTRTKTTGVVEKLIKVDDKMNIKLVDVGGQRNERRKWFSLFDQCTLVIFLCAASDYNKLLYEDDETNRMIENLNLFKETVNNRWFKNKPFVVLYNKMDVFKEKIQSGQNITEALPEYEGPLETEACIAYIKQKYAEQRETKAPIYAYETMATDTEMTKQVFEEVKGIIRQILKEQEQQA